MKFQVNVYREDCSNYTVATGKLSIKDMLDYPQNKLHYIAPVNSVLSCSLGANFGQLSLWVRLSCDVEKVEDFKKKRGLQLQTEFSEESSMKSSTTLLPNLSSQVPADSVHFSVPVAFLSSQEIGTSPVESLVESPVKAVVPGPKSEKVIISSDESAVSKVKEVPARESFTFEESKDQLLEYKFDYYTRRSSKGY